MVEPIELLFDPRDPNLLQDPYPAYRRMREQAPCWKSPDGIWYFTRYRDCFDLFRSPALSYDVTNSASFQQKLSTDVDERARQVEASQRDRSLLETDPPEHTRLRSLVNRAFTARSIESSRPTIESMVGRLLESFDSSVVDVVSQFALLVPILVICDMLGVPVEERSQFIEIGNVVARSVDPDISIDDRLAAMQQLRDYIVGLLEVRRRTPGDDLMTRLIDATEDGRLANENELIANAGVLLLAGFETTTNLIGNAVYQLLRHPDQLEVLRQDGTAILTTIEEVLRFDPPVHMMRPRTIVADTQIGDAELHSGDPVVPVLAAANRDPEEFEDPETFDVGRAVNRHLTFGLGHHLCIGASLARMEGQIAVSSLFERFPSLALADEEPEPRPNLSLRGFARLPVVLNG